MKLDPRIAAAVLVLSIAACGGAPQASSALSGRQPRSSAAQGGGGGGGGGGAQVPPPPTVDGPAWYIYNASAVTGTPPSPNVDFGALQNTVQGAIPIGMSRTAQVLVYNISKKTPLVISTIAVEGPGASDFSVAQASVNAALNVSIPPNKSAAVSLQLSFTPSAEGVRGATLRLVSNVGTALVSLTGEALPDRPIIATNVGASLAFFPDSAFDTIQVTNLGVQPLVLQSIGFGGASPASFQFFSANHGFSNCFDGIPISPLGRCFIGVGPVAGRVGRHPPRISGRARLLESV